MNVAPRPSPTRTRMTATPVPFMPALSPPLPPAFLREGCGFPCLRHMADVPPRPVCCAGRMPQLDGADADLRRGLGDFLARDRTDGVFHTEVGGPGSVPALAGLDAPELHAELLPEVPTDTQRAALVHLGYVPET